jgi:hypothetical protein
MGDGCGQVRQSLAGRSCRMSTADDLPFDLPEPRDLGVLPDGVIVED